MDVIIATPPAYIPRMVPSTRRRPSGRHTMDENNLSTINDIQDIVRSLSFNLDEKSIKIKQIRHSSLLHCDDNSECSICIENNVCTTNGGKLKCNHTFHTHCINLWFKTGKQSCPLCRSTDV